MAHGLLSPAHVLRPALHAGPQARWPEGPARAFGAPPGPRPALGSLHRAALPARSPQWLGVPLAAAAVWSAARRSTRAGRTAARAAAEGADAAPKRRRRRRKQPADEGTADAGEVSEDDDLLRQLSESAPSRPQPRPVCDCDHVLDTVVELDDWLTPEECDCLIKAAEARAAKVGWGEVKHSNYATADVKVWNLGDRKAIEIFRDGLAESMREVIADKFQLPLSMVELDDGFVVRYSPEGQSSLNFHRDGSIVSGIVSLSASDEYEGGGTVFRDGDLYRPERGSGILFAGQLQHSGVKVTAGTRYIATMFFTCGKLSCRDAAVAKDTETDGAKLWQDVAETFGFGG